MNTSIEEILAASGASLYADLKDPMMVARKRAALSRRIAAAYPAFEGLRDDLLERRSIELTPVHRGLLTTIVQFGLAEGADDDWRVTDKEARRYLSGGWLEEYVALAVAEIGADEVYTGQKIRWQVGGFVGENEIDVLARFGRRLFMCSCKALRSTLAPNDVRTRESLMDALHEADNLADHFAPAGGIVALAVTTDLLDERNRVARYEQLHGKAAALGVGLLTLEHLAWPEIIKRLSKIVSSAAETVA